jgi:predicted lipid-binding transport protein (Tim44 family)
MSQPPAHDLTVNKVLAGAGAAVTSAVLGSFFGVAGTVVGAAVGSVASTIATSLYEHSLNTTRDRIRARLNTGPHAGDPPDSDEEHEPAPRPPRHWGRWAGGTVLIFLLGMLVVTGIEFVKGSSIGGEPGTSVGRVFAPSSAAPETAAPSDSGKTESTRSDTRSTKERSTTSATPKPSASTTPTPSATPTTPAPAGAGAEGAPGAGASVGTGGSPGSAG